LNCRRRVPGREIEDEILGGKVPLCVACNSPAAAQSKKGSVKKSKKKKKGEWDSDCEDESDGPEYPPGVMKVREKKDVDLVRKYLLHLIYV
jgi:NAD-dependent histone deacetylase SIR2